MREGGGRLSVPALHYTQSSPRPRAVDITGGEGSGAWLNTDPNPPGTCSVYIYIHTNVLAHLTIGLMRTNCGHSTLTQNNVM